LVSITAGKLKMEDNLKFSLQMEDDLTFFEKERQPQFFEKWKTTLIVYKMEDDLNFKDNGRRPQFLGKSKKTSIFR
jgi:hypothetical protein